MKTKIARMAIVLAVAFAGAYAQRAMRQASTKVIEKSATEKLTGTESASVMQREAAVEAARVALATAEQTLRQAVMDAGMNEQKIRESHGAKESDWSGNTRSFVDVVIRPKAGVAVVESGTETCNGILEDRIGYGGKTVKICTVH